MRAIKELMPPIPEAAKRLIDAVPKDGERLMWTMLAISGALSVGVLIGTRSWPNGANIDLWMCSTLAVPLSARRWIQLWREEHDI